MNIINIALPIGSKRRRRVVGLIARVASRRQWNLFRREYNAFRREYYDNISKKHIIGGEQDALISIIVPCYNTKPRYLMELEDSVFAQGYDKWELILIDGSDDANISRLIKDTAARDSRVVYKRVRNKGIAANTNEGIKVARGDYIAFLDHDDVLDPDALAENIETIRVAAPDLLYSDEDKITEDGAMYHSPHFKPDFSKVMLECVNYITHFVVVKRSIAMAVGMIEQGFDGAQDYNFLLRVSEQTDKIVHVPKVLYHWREADTSTAASFDTKPNITRAGTTALNNHYARLRIPAKATTIKGAPGFYKTTYSLKPGTRRAIVISLPSLTEREKRFLLNKFQKHKDVISYKIDCILDSGHGSHLSDRYDVVMLVNHPSYPYDKVDKSISAVFGAVELGGYDLAMPKLVSRDKIFNAGYVNAGRGYASLFFGSHPSRPHYFGSPNWNRDVDAMNWDVVCGAPELLDRFDRGKLIIGPKIAVMGQYEFLALKGRNPEYAQLPKKSYFNPNLTYEMHPRMIEPQLIRYETEERQ